MVMVTALWKTEMGFHLGILTSLHFPLNLYTSYTVRLFIYLYIKVWDDPVTVTSLDNGDVKGFYNTVYIIRIFSIFNTFISSTLVIFNIYVYDLPNRSDNLDFINVNIADVRQTDHF